MVSQKTDEEIQDDVREELAWDPQVNVTDIGVTVHDGVVTLRGTVELYGEKWAAERDALRIAGVRALANELAVKPQKSKKHTDDEIALHVANTLLFDWSVPDDRIQAEVENGWVTLRGTTDWQYQRSAAEDDARRIAGVHGVINEITIVQPHVAASEIRSSIEQALVRTAEVDADNVKVAVDGPRVTLSGAVHSWAERTAAESAAWRAKGVTSVENAIRVQAF